MNRSDEKIQNGEKMRKIVFDFKGIEQEPVQNDGEKKQVVQRDSTEEMFEYINSVMENESKF